MDYAITVPRRAVSPPAALTLRRRHMRMPLHCFVLKETEMFQKKKQANKQANRLLQKYSFLTIRPAAWLLQGPRGDKACAADRWDGGGRHPVRERPRHDSWSRRCRSSRRWAEKRSGSCSFIWQDRRGRAAVDRENKTCKNKKKVEPGRGAPLCRRLAKLKHICQSWKDHAHPHHHRHHHSSQDHRRWTSSGEADETQVNQGSNRRKSSSFSFHRERQKAKTPCPHAATWAQSLINPRCWCLRGVKSERSWPCVAPEGSREWRTRETWPHSHHRLVDSFVLSL